MKYKTESDLRKRFTEEEFAKKVAKREAEVENYRAAWNVRRISDNIDIKKGLYDPEPVLETVHWIISYNNDEETRLGWAGGSYLGFDDETFDELTKYLNGKGFTYIYAKHATVLVYKKAGR